MNPLVCVMRDKEIRGFLVWATFRLYVPVVEANNY